MLMKYLALLAYVIAAPALAQDFPGLVSARLLPGWMDAGGTRFSALELALEPGWKTYWRSPGDTGIPPRFDWADAQMGEVTLFWPAPEVFDGGGGRAIGYHDRLLLPFSVAPGADGPAEELRAEVEFGLCREVCVPVSVALTAPGPGAPDPAIAAAIAAQPAAGDPALIHCAVEETGDGLRITASLPADLGKDIVAELADPDIWVSEPDITRDGARLTASFEAVAPSGKSFPLAGDAIRITALGGAQAVEFAACPLGGS